MTNERNSNLILVPAPTAWPLLAALGITLIFAGLVMHPAVTIVGVAVLLRAAVGWWLESLPEQQERPAEIDALDPTLAPVARSSRSVEHLVAGVKNHRTRIPVEVHPYWTGLYGGLAGAVAMALVATLFGLIAQGGIWYPVNLLAAGIMPSLSALPASELRHFNAAALVAGLLIHGTASLLVGLLYAVVLPMFPHRATWRSALITPVLWSGLIAASLSVVNPALNQRINWGWFVASQVAFGLVAGQVVARSAKIQTMQSWPLIERAGIDAQEHEKGSDL
jgi:hypothetical protein